METLRYIILVNTLLAVVSIAYYVLLRRETFFSLNRLALWLGLACALLFPLLELPDWRPLPVRAAMQRTTQAIVPKILPEPQPDVTITFPDKKTYRAFQNQPEKFAWNWQLSLIILYTIGFSTVLIRFSIQLVSLQRLIRKSLHEVYEGFTLAKNSTVTSPFSFFSWVVLNPANYTSIELEHILRHERVHVRERHSLDTIGAELVCIFFWFNPAAYLFRHLLHQTLEFRADQVVLTEGVDAKTYQFNLLKASLLSDQSRLTNPFYGPTLRQRIGMINGRPSDSLAWCRYVAWVVLLGTLIIACKHPHTDSQDATFVNLKRPFPLSNATRVLTNELDQEVGVWYRRASLLSSGRIISINDKPVVISPLFNYPEILCLKNNRLSLKHIDIGLIKVLINGQETAPSALSALTFEEVDDVLIYQKRDDGVNTSKYPESYRLFVSTTHKTPAINYVRATWKQFLLANAISDYPLGRSESFSMNGLLEATFFHNKFAFVKRKKDDYLKLYDEYADDIDVYINGLPANAKSLETVHIREVAKLYTRERSFQEWRTEHDRAKRFAIYVETAPQRAKRDSSYYVFSPFYSGDF
ncbi:M56 family metallopeptidase [Spirosoma sp.]|uniref:M56 family metallopeptidase n=1 Tax=Spirosoma sp. TaxID=1899569 RepID=UPI003B3A798A